MKPLRCILGSHTHVERHRHHEKTLDWYTKKAGVKIPNSDFQKVHEIVIYECSRENCSDQIAYRTVTIRNNGDDGKVESKIPVHVDLAKEEMFADKI